jgi:hypothetical protein
LPPDYTASQPRIEYYSRILHQPQLQNSLKDSKILVFQWKNKNTAKLIHLKKILGREHSLEIRKEKVNIQNERKRDEVG